MTLYPPEATVGVFTPLLRYPHSRRCAASCLKAEKSIMLDETLSALTSLASANDSNVRRASSFTVNGLGLKTIAGILSSLSNRPYTI